MKSKITLSTGNIAEVEADAIVNSANNDLVLGGGVAGALYKAGGPRIQEECNRIGTIPLGEAVATVAGQLKAKYVIHAAAVSLGLWATKENVRSATRNALRRAEERKCKTIALPAIGTGVGALSIDRSAEIVLEEILNHLKGGSVLEKVMLVLFDEKTFKAFEEKMALIDENGVMRKPPPEKEPDDPPPPPRPPAPPSRPASGPPRPSAGPSRPSGPPPRPHGR
jgi:O-acetyl-ADP-ribose deacetylase (regulator of RNase III)